LLERYHVLVFFFGLVWTWGLPANASVWFRFGVSRIEPTSTSLHDQCKGVTMTKFIIFVWQNLSLRISIYILFFWVQEKT